MYCRGLRCWRTRNPGMARAMLAPTGRLGPRVARAGQLVQIWHDCYAYSI